MTSRSMLAALVLSSVTLFTVRAYAVPANAAGEYSKHLAPVGKMPAVAQAMPAEKYGSVRTPSRWILPHRSRISQPPIIRSAPA